MGADEMKIELVKYGMVFQHELNPKLHFTVLGGLR